jgi:hypothetical protein
MDVSALGIGCNSASTNGTLEVTGTWTANDDGTYQDDTTTRGEVQVELASECLEVAGTPITCDRLPGPLAAFGLSSVVCSDAADGGCTCAATVEQTGGLALVSFDGSTSGTYTVAGDVVTMTNELGDADYGYCVSGQTLSIGLLSAGTTGVAHGQILLEK